METVIGAASQEGLGPIGGGGCAAPLGHGLPNSTRELATTLQTDLAGASQPDQTQDKASLRNPSLLNVERRPMHVAARSPEQGEGGIMADGRAQFIVMVEHSHIIKTIAIKVGHRELFLYDSVDQPLSEAVFAVPKVEGVTPAGLEALDANYTTRFINLRDGRDGRMSLRWGKQGPKGTSSGGLN